MHSERLEEMLTGGHPNSLGRTLEVVDIVLADQGKLEELYSCYLEDETVRLRTSNAIKRISREKPDWLVPYIGGYLPVIRRGLSRAAATSKRARARACPCGAGT
jgi:hypothetical protein